MDINSLLGPHESAARRASNTYLPPPPPTSNPHLSPTSSARSRRPEQPLLQRSTTAPHNHNRTMPPTLPPNAISQAQLSSSSSTSMPSSSPLAQGRLASSSHSTPTGDYRTSLAPQKSMSPLQQFRRPSADKMDYDVVPAQHAPPHGHHPHPHHNSRGIRTSISHEVLRSPSLSTPPTSRNNSIVPPTTTIDLTASDSPTLKSRTFTAQSLSKADLQTISELTKQLSENSYLYEAHQQLINLLHQGFVSHVFPPDSQGAFQDPKAYPLLPELRQARKAMDSRVPVGEELWVDWIQDEIMLAKSTDDRVTVMELCQKAVQDEAGSAKLWRMYGDWMWMLYKITHNLSGGYESKSLEQHSQLGPILKSHTWTKADRTVGAEVFGWNPMLDVWIQGIKATEWHMNDSHIVWDPYVEILLHDLSRNPSPEKVKHVWTFYAERLQKPHATWQDTFQGFSQFVTSNYDNSIYEDTMIAANKQSAGSKHEYELREDFEIKLQRAADQQDSATELAVMTDYLEWEATQSRRKNASPFGFDLNIALLERANLRFPTAAEWWEDHVDMITENTDTGRELLPLLHRATRHCPWSGNLWSKYIYALEAASKPFEELEDVKHRATSTGLLEEIGGMDELIKVFNSWCGFLRRRAFAPEAGEDERDVAEMGIRSVIENVKDIGARKYGKEFKGDPLFRAEKIYLKFLPQVGRYDEARETWNKLTATHGDMYDFWDRYYLWEMTVWAKQTNFEGGPPVKATRVLQQAIRRPNLDYPEKILELYVHHCSQHETVQRLQEGHTEARRAGKQLAKRREKEAADAARAQSAAVQQQQAYSTEAIPAQGDSSQGHAKRKREDDNTSASPSKRTKSDDGREEQPQTVEASASETSQLKRDRENTTVIVKHLPADTTEKRVRQFFRDCGDILSFQMAADNNDESQTATIEFETKEDVLAAQTKSMKSLDGNAIDVQVGTGTTLWVTNYPPEADEQYLRDLFKDCGDVVNIRFPSLKFNTHRRFCYIQFPTSAQAQAATKLDGKLLSGNLKLSAKISDPTARKDRTGAMHEGREIFVGNVSYNATEGELRQLFDKFGTVQSVRVPRNMAGKSKSIAFIVFSTKEEAEAAVEMNLTDFKDRLLKVTISRPNAQGSKRSATTIINSASPESSGVQGSAVSAASPGSTSAAGEKTTKDYLTRSIVLKNIPDTVNDARIRALMEKYGSLRKVTIRPEKNEALVEFDEVSSVGKAEMGVQGHELAPGMKVEVVSVPERRSSGAVASRAGFSTDGRRADSRRNGFVNTFSSGPVRRPGQIGGAKRGGRGGLGFKSAGESTAPKPAQAQEADDKETEDTKMLNGVDDERGEAAPRADAAAEKVEEEKEEEEEGDGGEAKSNNDFRAMLQEEK